MASEAPILCVGAAHWDVIARADAPLDAGADVPGRVRRRPGGVALNVALALAALGRPVALLAAVGRDAAGDELLAAAAAGGVDCAHVARHAGATDGYVAIEDRAGEVFAAVADCAGLERVGAAVLRPLRAGVLRAPGQVVVDGNLPEAVLAELAAVATARLAMVPASPGKADRLRALLGRANVTLYLNRREAEVVCGRGFPGSREAALALWAKGVAEVVVTDGAAAATLANRESVLSVAPRAVATRSLTGAGDVFLAAHLVARADGLAPEAALRTALAASARHISRAAS